MKDNEIPVTCLMETWRVTSNNFVTKKVDGYSVLNLVKTTRNFNGGRYSAVIILIAAAWAAGELGDCAASSLQCCDSDTGYHRATSL